MAEGKAKYPFWEALGIGSHLVLYTSLLLSVFSYWQAGLFVLLHQGLWGLYLGTVFAPNHKGMPVIGRESELGFLEKQVLTTRNIRPHPLTDFWYGGLNYQIEHHLFPTMPRNNLKHARRLVKEFCETHSLAYYETGVLQSYLEVYRHLDKVGNGKDEQPLAQAIPSIL
jgi:fatty acid desaturase